MRVYDFISVRIVFKTLTQHRLPKSAISAAIPNGTEVDESKAD